MEQYNKESLSNAAKVGWLILGLVVPIAGLILWLVWRKDEPERSQWCRNGFIIWLIISAASFLLMLFGTVYYMSSISKYLVY